MAPGARLDVDVVLFAALEGRLTSLLVVPADMPCSRCIPGGEFHEVRSGRGLTCPDREPFVVNAGDRLVCRATGGLPDAAYAVNAEWAVHWWGSMHTWVLTSAACPFIDGGTYPLTSGRELTFTVTEAPTPIDTNRPADVAAWIEVADGGRVLTLHRRRAVAPMPWAQWSTRPITPELVWQAFPPGHLALNVTAEVA